MPGDALPRRRHAAAATKWGVFNRPIWGNYGFSRTFRAVVEVSNEHVEEPSLVKVFLAHAHIAPIPAGLAVVGVVSTADHVVITSSPDQPSAACPTCARMSQRLHSRYQRILADLPWQGRPVALQVVARRFRCLNPFCARQTFAERLVGVTPAAALPDQATGRPARSSCPCARRRVWPAAGRKAGHAGQRRYAAADGLHGQQ